MKKIRIMLMVIAILAAAGGALAVKAKKFGTGSYCITTTGTTCCLSLTMVSFAPGGNIRYVVTTAPTRCSILWPVCTGVGRPVD